MQRKNSESRAKAGFTNHFIFPDSIPVGQHARLQRKDLTALVNIWLGLSKSMARMTVEKYREEVRQLH